MALVVSTPLGAQPFDNATNVRMLGGGAIQLENGNGGIVHVFGSAGWWKVFPRQPKDVSGSAYSVRGPDGASSFDTPLVENRVISSDGVLYFQQQGSTVIAVAPGSWYQCYKLRSESDAGHQEDRWDRGVRG